MQYVILAGGLGSRIRGYLPEGTPKFLAPVGARPLADRILQGIQSCEPTSVLLLLGHLSNEIESYVKKEWPDLPWSFSTELVPLGTGGALRAAADMLDDQFILLNGDTYAQLDYVRLETLTAAHPLVMSLVQVEDAGRFGLADVREGRVISIKEKAGNGPGLVNAGVYGMWKRHFLASVPATIESLETGFIMKQAVSLGPPYLLSPGPFFDIGVPSDFDRANRFFGQTWE